MLQTHKLQLMKHVLLLLAVMFFSSAAFSQNNYESWLHPKTLEKKIDLKIYPNPVTDYFNISDNDVVEKIIVFNMVGRKIKQFSYAKGSKYVLSGLTKGVYLIQMLTIAAKCSQ